MKRSNRLILLIGVFLAALAFVFIIILLSGGNGGGGGGGSNASAPPAKVATVVAARDIPLGVKITADMLTTQELSPANVLPGALGAPSQIVGQVARQSLTKGQQVTSFVSNPTNQVVEVPAGFTGLAVQVDQVSGAGTLIKAGDYVDIVASISPTFPVTYFLKSTDPAPVADGAKYDPTSIKVLLQGIQVVTTLLPPPPAAQTGTASPAPATGGTALNGQQEIVILAVTPQQAEVIKFAQLDGTISLALRSPKDFVDANGNPIIPTTIPTTGIVLKSLIDAWGVLPPLPVIVAPPVPAK